MIVRRKTWLAACSALALTVGISGAAGLSAAPALAFMTAAPQGLAAPSLLRQAAFDQTVYDVQRGLNALGYDAGPADGLIGSRTRNAIRAYERDKGLLVTGNASYSLSQSIQRSIDERSQASSAASTASQAETEMNIDIQSNLRRLGYETRITGKLDSQTKTAIESYQRDQKLLVTGQPSLALLEKMRASPTPAAQAGSQGANEQLVTSIQSELRKRGYSIPVITGELNSETETAIRSYQRDNGLLVTGQASQLLLERLQSDQNAQQAMTRREQIKAVQEALNKRGYSAGTADGALGLGTKNAIRTYESDSGMAITGDLSPNLLNRLGIEVEASAEAEATTEATAPVFATRLEDNFADGNHSRSPSWQVLAGEFTVVGGKLKSTVVKPQQTTQEQIGRSLISGVLNQALGVSLPGMENAAAISQSTSVANIFHMSAELTGGNAADALINLGFYQGREASSGYRLVYLADDPKPFRLVAAEGENVALIASTAPAVKLNDGRPHKIDWSREADGKMSVRLDGALVMTATDNRFTGGFDGISLINGSGAWTLDDLKVETPES